MSVLATAVYIANPNYPAKLFKKWNIDFEDMPGIWYEALHYIEEKMPAQCADPKYHKILAYRRLCTVFRDNAVNVGAQLPDRWDILDRTKTKKWTNLQQQYQYESDQNYEDNSNDDDDDNCVHAGI